MALQGKGFFIWKIPSCENGNAESIATQAANAKFTHVLVKIADGSNYSNYDTTKNVDYVPAVINALKNRGIETWGWHYVYGSDPLKEARVGGARAKALGVKGYVVDAEIQFESAGKDVTATSFMTEVRKYLPNLPIALSTFRYPSYHQKFPFKAFLDRCDLSMPQVYWEEAHNADAQLTKCVQEYRALPTVRPIFPTGPTYKVGSWAPTQKDITLFLKTAKTLNLPGVNFFSWDECRRDLNAIWTYIRDYAWTVTPAMEFQDQYIAGLNSKNPDTLINMYSPLAVQITSSQIVQGTEAIKTWYSTLFNQLLPNATFNLVGSSGTGATRHINWSATSSRGNVSNGSDSFGLINNQIIYHYSNFKIS